MAKTADEMVIEIRKFFQDSGVERVELLKFWEVLTGLRGPDSGDDHEGVVKAATTAVIRHFVLQVDLETHRRLPIDVAVADDDGLACIRRGLVDDTEVSPHFLDHAQRAFNALGLSWDQTNVEPKPLAIIEDEAKNIPNGSIEPYPGWD